MQHVPATAAAVVAADAAACCTCTIKMLVTVWLMMEYGGTQPHSSKPPSSACTITAQERTDYKAASERIAGNCFNINNLRQSCNLV